MTQKSRILILATGGTIAGQADNSTSVSYTSGQVPIETLISFAKELGLSADLKAEQISNVGSQDMDTQIWSNLYERISSAFAEDEADAVIISHGTDTVEETAFLLDLILPAGRPVVMVSAMRPANVIGSDGSRNIACAIRVAQDTESEKRGVLVVMGDRVFSARDVYKAGTHGTDAFRGFPGGVMGSVTPSSLRYYAGADRALWRGVFPFPKNGTFPAVGILHIHAAMSMAEINAVTSSSELSGVVLAGVGHGNLPKALRDALAKAVDGGLHVVRSSRINEGVATHNLEVSDDRLGFVAGGYLSPQKSRILLQLLLASGRTSLAEIRQTFQMF